MTEPTDKELEASEWQAWADYLETCPDVEQNCQVFRRRHTYNEGKRAMDPANVKVAHEPTETEIIRNALERAAENCSRLEMYTKGNTAQYAIVLELVKHLDAASSANDKRAAREVHARNTRQLTIDVGIRDLTEPMVRALLCQGFELALQACAEQVVKAVQDDRKSRRTSGCVAWVPPINPFCAEPEYNKPKLDPSEVTSGRITRTCTCPNDPPGAQRITPDCPVHGAPR